MAIERGGDKAERAGFSFLRKLSHGDAMITLTVQAEFSALNKG